MLHTSPPKHLTQDVVTVPAAKPVMKQSAANAPERQGDESKYPDGRYFVVKERLWRCSNPALDGQVRQLLVNELMDARRTVKAAKASGDSSDEVLAQPPRLPKWHWENEGRSGGRMARPIGIVT